MIKNCWRWIAAITVATLTWYASFRLLNDYWTWPTAIATTGNRTRQPNAVIIALIRDEDYTATLSTLAAFEKTFNAKYNYPYVFLNDKPFSDRLKLGITQFLADRSVSFGLVPKEHWSYPEWIDQKKAAETRSRMEPIVIYGGSTSYRHMCRFYSGFFYRHPLLLQYDYYWRIEPGADYYCQMDYDPFVFMMKNNIEYGFVQMMPEHMVTVATLWNTTKKYLKEVFPKFKKPTVGSPVLGLVLDAENRTTRDEYVDRLFSPAAELSADFESSHNVSWSGCHFWSNFEIGHFGFFRSALYQSYFDYLDKAGGFFYERWGDAPVHTLAAGLFLNYSQIHHFDDIGYFHAPYSWCPTVKEENSRCTCDVNFGTNMAQKGSKDGNGGCIFKLLGELEQFSKK